MKFLPALRQFLHDAIAPVASYNEPQQVSKNEIAMSPARNQFGVPQYPPTDARRLFVLLSAIDLLERPTVAAIADLTDREREDIEADIQTLREQYGVALTKIGEVYHIESWGEVLKKNGVKKYLKPSI
jgi:hypothetical protein